MFGPKGLMRFGVVAAAVAVLAVLSLSMVLLSSPSKTYAMEVSAHPGLALPTANASLSADEIVSSQTQLDAATITGVRASTLGITSGSSTVLVVSVVPAGVNGGLPASSLRADGSIVATFSATTSPNAIAAFVSPYGLLVAVSGDMSVLDSNINSASVLGNGVAVQPKDLVVARSVPAGASAGVIPAIAGSVGTTTMTGKAASSVTVNSDFTGTTRTTVVVREYSGRVADPPNTGEPVTLGTSSSGTAPNPWFALMLGAFALAGLAGARAMTGRRSS